MAVYIDEKDMSFFQSDGYSQEDIQNTVNHYRSSGMSDELIQNKINARLNELKLNSNNSNVRTNEQNGNQPKMLQGAVMYSTPKKNPIDRFRECLDWVGKTAMSAYQEGREQVEVADLEIKNMLGLDNSLDKARLNELSNKQPKQYHNFGVRHSSDYIDENITNVIPRTRDAIAKSYIEALKMLPYMWETIKATSGGVAVGSVGGAIVGGVATKTPQGALGGARIGGSWAGRISGSMRLAELEGGLARNELRQINEEIISKGGEPLSDAEINMLAIGVGGVNAGLELVSLKQALKTVPGGDKILDYFKNKQVRELATNKTVRDKLKEVLANYTGAITTEMLTEMAQETTNIIADETARKMGKIENTPLEKNVARVLDTGKATFGAMMLMGGISSTAKVATIYMHQGLSKHQAEKLANQMTPEEKESFIADNMDTLFKSVEDYLKDKDNSLKYADVKNKLYEQIKSTGISDEESLYNSELFVRAMAGMADLDNISIDKIHDMFKLNIQQLTTEQAQNVLKGGVAYQSAMYKSPKENFTDFYNQVFEKENEAKQNNSKVQKSYFEYKNGDITLRVKHDAVNHSDKKHQLSPTEWEDVLNNISNIENAGISNKQFSNDNVALIKVATPSGKYGVTIQFANGTNQIATVFKSTDKGIDKWIEKGSANSSTSEPLTSRDNSHTVAVVGQNPNNIISYVKQKLNPKEFANQNIEKNFGQSVEELQNNFTDDIKNILAENEIDYDEFEIEDVRLYGSYTTGKNKDTSDLDVIVQYKGSMKEDAAFNIFNDENLTITDVNGVERKVDINPINRELSGTIDEHIERMHEIDGAYFQTANTAGAETSAEISDAQKEWQEKGTDSKYFKKWFGESKVVDENGKPLVVYHGTNAEFDTFDKNKIGSATDDGIWGKGFYFGNMPTPYGNKQMQLYLKMENPFIINDFKTVEDIADYLDVVESNFRIDNDNLIHFSQSQINQITSHIKEKGHDGIIVKQGKWIEYVAFEPSQIKSIDNRGTFDEGNANIYYQSESLNENQKEQLFEQEYVNKQQIKEYEEKLADDIKKHLNNEMSSGSMINFCKAPAILQHFGVPNKSMLMSQNKYDCSTNRKTIKGSIHNISDDVMKKLPELLANPLVIAEPTDNSIYDGNNRYVVTIDALDNDNKPINVIVDYDWTGNKINIIPSVYGSEEFDIYLENCIKQNKIIYTNKKVLTSRTRVQFPRGSKNSNNIITDKEDIINYIVKKISNIHYQFIGKDGAKENSTLFNLYNTAIKMESAGSLPIQIKNATGWFKGIDGKWRYEISDADARIINENNLKFKGDATLTFEKYNSEIAYFYDELNKLVKERDNGEITQEEFQELYDFTLEDRRLFQKKYQENWAELNKNFYKLGDILEHEKLYALYPSLKNLTVEIIKPNGTIAGSYSEDGIKIAESVVLNGNLKSVLMHEIQHYIQDMEDFNRGGSVKSVERVIKTALDIVKDSTTEKQRVELEKVISDEYKKLNVMTCALQTQRVRENEKNLFKTYWWNEHGSWYVPRKTRKKEYKAFMEEWTEKYLKGVLKEFETQGLDEEYLKYCVMDINDVRRQCRNLDARINRLLNKKPKDVARNLKRAIELLESGEPKEEVKKQLYNNLAGEVEARNTEKRMNLTEEERKSTPVKSTQDVDDISQIVIFSDGSTIPFCMSEDLANESNPLDSKRGFSTVRQDFDGTIKENLIVLLKGHADKSTLMHEFAHVYLMTLNQLAKIDAKAQMNLTTINKYLRYNGIEYTEQQHEKFARGFEAYLKAGKAPTYKLKKAFEHFQSWLTSIYSRIENGDWQEELTLDDETKKVFDQILGDSAYSKKVEKAQELIEKAKANANVLMNQEFASKKKIEPMTLTDRQKRYRDTAFDILYTALHNTKDENGNPYIKDKKELYMLFSTNKKMKQNNKGVFKRAEKLRFILEELDDPFSGGNYLPEWAEFFGYYDENEMYDSDLALAALDVIENKKYLYSESELGDFFTDEDLQHIEYECDYLINEFKNSKGDERDVAMLAYWDWIESVPDFVQEDFLNKWQLKTTEIERYENLDKFQQAKEDLVLYAQKMKHQGSYSMQFAEFARQIIKRLDFLTIQDKGKMWAKFKDYDSFDAMLRDIDSIMDYAQTIEAVSDRKMMANEIDREVQQTIHEWKNGIKKTKYTYPANKLFERLRQIRKMSMEEIEDVYGAMVNEESEITYEADKVHDEDYYKTIEKMYIEFRMNGQYYNSSQFLANLLDRIKTAKFTAKVARDEIDFERRMQQINLIDECAKAVNSHKGKVSKLEQVYSAEFNLNSALEMMFNTAVKEKFTLDYLYSQKDAQVGADRDVVLKQIAKVFGLENKKFAEMRLFNIFINMTKPEFKIRQRYTPDTQLGTHRVTHTDKETGKQVTEQSIAIRPKGEGYKEWEDEEIELSRMQVLYYYIQAKNPTSYKILTDMGDETHPPKGQFDGFEFNDLINQLTPQEKLMGDILQLAAEKYYDKLNQYHIEKYHTELGKVKGYFPRKTSTIQEKVYEPFNDYTQSMSNQRFQKQRTAGAGSRIKPANALEVLFTHIEQANTILIMGKQLDLMNRVFSNPDLKEKIRVVWGDRVQQDFYNQIAGNLFGGQTSALSNAEKDCASIMNNVIKSQIFAKPQVGVKQLMSFMNYGVGDEYVSAGEWWLEFAKQTLTPTQWKKNVEYMMSIPYMKDRFGRGGSQDALKQQLETRFYAKINLLDSILSAPIRYGDIGAIILGGKPYIDILIRKGYTEEQAQRIFIEKTVNDQQSGIPSTLSNMQRNSGKSPLSKMFFAYQNTPHQYFRTAYNSIVRFKQNPNLKTGLDMAKITSIYMYIFPLLFNMASSLSVAIATGQGDDDELWKDIWKSCIGGFTFIPIAGSFINSIWTGLNGEGVYGGDWFASAAGKANTIARHASKGEITPMDIFLAVALFGEAKTGLPLTALGTELSGVGDIAQGKVAKGLLKVAGFTDYRAKKVTGEDE